VAGALGAITGVLGSKVVAGSFDRAIAGTRTVAFHGVASSADFERNLLILLRHYEPVRAADRSSSERRRPLVITFDDGHASTVERALPVLVRHRVPAVMFVCPDFVESDGIYWWDVVEHAESLGHGKAIAPDADPARPLVTQLKQVSDEVRRDAVAKALELVCGTVPRNAARRTQLDQWLESGMDLGNHTWDHPCLDKCDDASQRWQVTEAHRWLSEFIGAPPRLFAYPNGDWSMAAEEALVGLGYDSAFLFDHRVERRDGDPLRRSRLRLDADADPVRVRAIASGAHPAVFHLGPREPKSPASASERSNRDEPVEQHDNLEVFDSPALVASYNPVGGLTPAEQVLVDRWVPPGSRILDLGVGTGRTYPALAVRASTYVGSDYSPQMVEEARRAHPAGFFEVVDASDLSRYQDESFDVVVFSYNGLDYLHPEQMRTTALSEIWRVLVPGGVFIMSSHNPRAILSRPSRGSGGWRAQAKAVTIALYATLRATRSLVPTRAFWTGEGSSVDRIQPLLTRYSTAERLLAELSLAGLDPLDVIAGDHPQPMRRFVSPWTYVSAQRPMADAITVTVMHGDDAWDEIAEDWDRLAAVNGASFFQSRPWCQAWREQLAPTAELSVAVARASSGEVVGLLPLAWSHRQLHRRMPLRLRYLGLAGAGPGAADHLGPLTTDPAVAARLFTEARRVAGRRTVYLENLSDRWAPIATAALNGRVIRLTPWLASNRTDGQSFEDNWSRKMRKNDRRRQRQLVEAGVSARWIPSSNPEFPEALEALRRVHLERWGDQGATGLFDDQRLRFLLAVGERCRGADLPWVLLLESDSSVVGGLLGFRSGDAFNVYKTGWNPRYAQLGIGMALGAEAMRWAEQQGITTFDYLRGQRGHKIDLGCVPSTDYSIISARRLSGRLLTLREGLGADGTLPRWWPSR
jgi:CelD/BcsL family acetyltransferase involved in cellulose biosynthesis/peptidoglycan/xylan/chitin deacetylase (PgdA/CDA1 family)/SAM-dependent methyltransferase